MKSVFIVGSGKCGESFLNKIFKKNSHIECFDETRPLLQAYYKFIKYNKLNIDEAPLFSAIENSIKKSNRNKKIYLESSSYLIFHINELVNKFNSKIIILIRNPNHVSQSLNDSGWYNSVYEKSGSNKVLGYQGIATSFHNKHHNFSRIAPNGKYFFKWNKLNSIIKSKWYWDEVNKYLLKTVKKISKKKYKIFQIEKFNFENYLEICKWLKVKPNLNIIQFKFLVNIERIKKKKISQTNINLLKKYKSKIEKQFYPENLK